MTRRKGAWLAGACAVGALLTGGCGLKGALYLPEPVARPPASAGASAPQKADGKRDAEPAH